MKAEGESDQSGKAEEKGAAGGWGGSERLPASKDERGGSTGQAV